MFLKTHQLVPKFHIPDHFQVGHKTVHSARMSPPLAWFGPSYPTQPNSSKPAKRSQSQQAGRRTQDLKGKGWRKPKRSVNILHFCVQWKRRHLDGAVDVNGGWGMGLGAGGDVTTGESIAETGFAVTRRTIWNGAPLHRAEASPSLSLFLIAPPMTICHKFSKL